MFILFLGDGMKLGFVESGWHGTAWHGIWRRRGISYSVGERLAVWLDHWYCTSEEYGATAIGGEGQLT
jgi:hypothetical protein